MQPHLSLQPTKSNHRSCHLTPLIGLWYSRDDPHSTRKQKHLENICSKYALDCSSAMHLLHFLIRRVDDDQIVPQLAARARSFSALTHLAYVRTSILLCLHYSCDKHKKWYMSRGHVDCFPLASRPDLESYSVDPLLWPTVAVTSLVTGAVRCESVQHFVKVARGPSLVRKAGGGGPWALPKNQKKSLKVSQNRLKIINYNHTTTLNFILMWWKCVSICILIF